MLPKINIYGYLNRVLGSRRLERECQRNIELMWSTGRLAPDFKTIDDFRRDSGRGIRRLRSLPGGAAVLLRDWGLGLHPHHGGHRYGELQRVDETVVFCGQQRQALQDIRCHESRQGRTVRARGCCRTSRG